MSPFAGQILLSSVIPLIIAGIRSGIKTLETEDEQELIQDATPCLSNEGRSAAEY